MEDFRSTKGSHPLQQRSETKTCLREEKEKMGTLRRITWLDIPVPGVAVALVHEQDIVYFILYVEGVQRDWFV